MQNGKAKHEKTGQSLWANKSLREIFSKLKAKELARKPARR